jgi:hypothetical protein
LIAPRCHGPASGLPAQRAPRRLAKGGALGTRHLRALREGGDQDSGSVARAGEIADPYLSRLLIGLAKGGQRAPCWLATVI